MFFFQRVLNIIIFLPESLWGFGYPYDYKNWILLYMMIFNKVILWIENILREDKFLLANTLFSELK